MYPPRSVASNSPNFVSGESDVKIRATDTFGGGNSLPSSSSVTIPVAHRCRNAAYVCAISNPNVVELIWSWILMSGSISPTIRPDKSSRLTNRTTGVTPRPCRTGGPAVNASASNTSGCEYSGSCNRHVPLGRRSNASSGHSSLTGSSYNANKSNGPTGRITGAVSPGSTTQNASP